ncbi:porin family protein [Pontibacter sp. SGAir0037]|uniref:porin family protein n=1 Tax=Pontibacter sp. SGAir0037 TaxID=2571030 RepID=UPI0010CCC5E5|nr:porin family protein [Pontibacter sp. SGAir0037]QCR24374.1 PorT family protein [Pontibacter sp. SGAir0037]
MKKEILLLLILLSATASSYAQYSRFGAKVGGGYTTITGSDVSSASIDNKAGLHAGIIYNFDFVSSLSFQSELLYSRKGFIYNNQLVGQNEMYAGDVNFNYLELPLLIRVQRFGLFLEAGPYLGYLLHAGSDVNRVSLNSTGGTEPTVIGRQDFSTADFKRFDYGYAVGAGFIMDNGFFISIRNTGGLRSISTQDAAQRNMAWQLSLGFLMPVFQPAGL